MWLAAISDEPVESTQSTSANNNAVPEPIKTTPSSSSQENVYFPPQEPEIPVVSFDELLLKSTKRENNQDFNKTKRVCLGAEVITRAEVDTILNEKTMEKSKLEKIRTLLNKRYLRAAPTMTGLGTAIQAKRE